MYLMKVLVRAKISYKMSFILRFYFIQQANMQQFQE